MIDRTRKIISSRLIAFFWHRHGWRERTVRTDISIDLIICIEDDSAHHRKSERSICINPGLYADVLDCSLFHYCHGNRHHEILKCPEELHFDPKTLICSSPKLVNPLSISRYRASTELFQVNCQYEPPITLHEQKSRHSNCLLRFIRSRFHRQHLSGSSTGNFLAGDEQFR